MRLHVNPKDNDWTLLKDQPAASSFIQKQDKEK